MLKPYPSYRGSGVPWLGQLPSHWEVQRLKYVLQEKDIRSVDGSEQLLRVSQYTGVTQRLGDGLEEEPDTRAESLIGYKCVEPSELVINIMLAWNGSLGVSRFFGITSPAYCVYQFNSGSAPWYFHHLLRSSVYKSRIRAVSTGVVESRLRLYTDDLFRLEAFVPPLSEQSAIVRFLEHADRRIRRYIRAKEKLIALLEEQKQAIINQAVTGRIDVRTGQPYPAYKPSGVEWLGDVPAHWNIRRLKFLASIPSGQVDPRLKEHRHKVLIAPNHISPGSGKLTDLKTADEQGADSGKYEIRVGDVIYSKIRPNLRKAAISPVNGLCSADMYPIRVREDEIDSSFFLQLLLSDQVTKYTVDCSLRVAMPKVNREALGNCLLAYPMLSEQSLILEKILDESARLELVISEGNLEIELLREYRARLIADVVTGKLDVREAADALPAEPDDSDAVEDDYIGAKGRDYGDPERDRRTEAPTIQEELTS